MMRKTTTLLVILCNCIWLKGQFIENKIDLGFGSSVSTPLKQDYIANGHFSYPALYGNYPGRFSARLMLNYNVSKSFRIGMDLDNIKFSSWEGDQQLFILDF
jgi:hypothetical protein